MLIAKNPFCLSVPKVRFPLATLTYIYTSREARLRWASLLWRSSATALQRRWLGDSTSSNALSISLFAPMAPMMAIPCQCSSGRMKPSYGKANPYACGTCPFCLHCVIPVVLTPNRCEIPRCHGCACDLLVCVRELCTQATKSS